MANRVGRPTKEELEEKMKLEYNPDVRISNEGVLIYEKSLEDVELEDKLYSLISTTFNGPISPIIMNFGLGMDGVNNYNELGKFYNMYGRITNYRDKLVNDIADFISSEFHDNAESVEYYYQYYSNSDALAHYFTMKLDLRRINHNWSIIYQIVSDIHYKLFGYFFGVYILELPQYHRDPVATLHIFISEIGVLCPRNLSDIINKNISQISYDGKLIVENIYNTYIVPNHPNNIPVMPVFSGNPNLSANYINTKLTDKYYLDYSMMYGPYIYDTTPEPLIDCGINLLRHETPESMDRKFKDALNDYKEKEKWNRG